MGIYAEVRDGVVVNTVVWDGNIYNWSPPEGSEAVALEEGSDVSIGYLYDGANFTPPPKPAPTPAEILMTNTAAKDAMLAVATLAIAPLQDAVDLDEATAEETALLKKWKQYRIAVNRIDLTIASPPWPAQP
ncbi:tail fiber assembly protein [Pseudomonas moorei]|uniref:tail fiber assembly protein n=1 Tax=Pseudomonas moorei TaxID=395599 RepID=UPI0036F3D981